MIALEYRQPPATTPNQQQTSVYPQPQNPQSPPQAPQQYSPQQYSPQYPQQNPQPYPPAGPQPYPPQYPQSNPSQYPQANPPQYPQQGLQPGLQPPQPGPQQQGMQTAPQSNPQSGTQGALQQALQQGIEQFAPAGLQSGLQQGLQQVMNQLPQRFAHAGAAQTAQEPAGQLAPQAPNPQQLYAQSRDSAARMYTAVAQQYLEFRRHFFGDPNPSLSTAPPSSDAIQQTETGKIANRALNLMPHAVRELPLVRELMDHLQWEVDIHTLTARERTALHNLAMVFLYGTDGGIQAWYVNWLLDEMHRIQGVAHPKYYLAYPWQGLLYRSPQELAAFDKAVASGNVLDIERHMEHYASQLIMVLRDPLATQPKLAFSGPHGEERHILFNLKTSAAIALGAYLAVEAVRDLLGQHATQAPPQSVLAPFPPQITQRMLPDAPLPGNQ